MSIHMTGDLAKIQARIAELPETMLQYAEEVLLDSAHLIRDLAKVYCPVDTGSLQSSIRVQRGGRGKRWREVSVRAGGYIINPKTGKFVDYAGYVEARQPYLLPAAMEVTPTVADMIKARVVQEVSDE